MNISRTPENNSIDFGKIYGIDNCPGKDCVQTGEIIPGVPSLEQIASYNQQIFAQKQKEGSLGKSPQVKNSPETNLPSTSEKAGIVNSATEQFEPITPYNEPFPVTGESIQYLNGFLRTQLGREIKAEFLVGNNSLVTKEGYLLGIGANYILINESFTNDLTTCDFYNLKFVTIYY